MPANWQPPTELLPSDWTNVVLITVNASSLPLAVLQRVEVMAIVGQDAEITVNDFANTVGRKSLQLSVAESKAFVLGAIQRDYILLPTSRMSVPGAM